jgi:predicted RNase H-like nuclease (RuvC/YqgF family)
MSDASEDAIDTVDVKEVSAVIDAACIGELLNTFQTNLMGQLKSTLRDEVSTLRDEVSTLRDEVSTLREQVTSEVSALREQVTSELIGLKKDLSRTNSAVNVLKDRYVASCGGFNALPLSWHAKFEGL